MSISKKLAAFAVAIAAGTMLAAPTNAVSLAQKPSAHPAAKVDVQYYRGYRRYTRSNRGPVYSRSFMNCINSGHPADFCRQVGWKFRH
jgi:hypothetical protein